MKKIIMLAVVVLVMGVSVVSFADSVNDQVRRALAKINYNMVSVTTVKIGDAVLKSYYDGLFTKQYYETYERPILLKIKARCITSGKIYESTVEGNQIRNKWGEWDLATGFGSAFPYSECPTQADIQANIEKQKRSLAIPQLNKQLIPYAQQLGSVDIHFNQRHIAATNTKDKYDDANLS